MPFRPADLIAIHRGIAALRKECVRVEREMHACPRDERHDVWEAELKDIKERTSVLMDQKSAVLRQFVKETQR